MMRLTNSASEMPSRLASRFKNSLCGSVNEIICLVMDRLGPVKGYEMLLGKFSQCLQLAFGYRLWLGPLKHPVVTGQADTLARENDGLRQVVPLPSSPEKFREQPVRSVQSLQLVIVNLEAKTGHEDCWVRLWNLVRLSFGHSQRIPQGIQIAMA